MKRTASQPSLLGTNEVLVADEVVTAEEQATLLAWAERQYRDGKISATLPDPGAWCTPFQSIGGGLTTLTNASAQQLEGSAEQRLVWVPEVDEGNIDRLPEEFWRIRARVVERLDLAALDEDHYKGSFLTYISPGAGVHRHRDARLMIRNEEFLILRCNVLFRRPEAGGQPVVESIDLEVPDRGMWAFFPTEHVHAATPVRGSAFRGLLSFGFLVRLEDLWQRRFRMTTDFAQEHGVAADAEHKRALIDALRAAPESSELDAQRIDLLEFIVMSDDEFSVQDAADSLQRSPAELCDALHDFQRSRIVESRSSRCADRGRVTVL